MKTFKFTEISDYSRTKVLAKNKTEAIKIYEIMNQKSFNKTETIVTLETKPNRKAYSTLSFHQYEAKITRK